MSHREISLEVDTAPAFACLLGRPDIVLDAAGMCVAMVAEPNAAGSGGTASFHAADPCDPAAVAPAIAAIRAGGGAIDIAISATNSCAVPGLFHTLDPAAIVAQLNEQALAALLLASPGAARLTDQMISVNGGISAA